MLLSTRHAKVSKPFDCILRAVIALLAAATATAAAEPSGGVLNVGVIAPLTGARSDAGQQILNAVGLAKEQLQRTGHPVRIFIEDSGYEPRQAVSAFTKLVEIHSELPQAI